MSEPAMTSEQSELLIDLFVRQIRTQCICNKDTNYVCRRCQIIGRMKNAFPGTYVAACVKAADTPHG